MGGGGRGAGRDNVRGGEGKGEGGGKITGDGDWLRGEERRGRGVAGGGGRQRGGAGRNAWREGQRDHWGE